MSEFIDERKKDLLMYMVDEFIPSDLYEDQAYEESLDFVISTFIKKPSMLLSFLSIRTLNYLKDKITGNNIDKPFNRGMFLLEDYSALIYLGIIDYDSLDINEKYNEVIREMLKLPNIENIVYKNTILKGLIDLYGYVEIETLKKIYLYEVDSNVNPLDFSITKMVETCGLIYANVYIDDNAIYRKELQEKIKPFLELRIERNKNLKAYKLFSASEILHFQGRFTFADSIDYIKNPDLVKLYLNKVFFMVDKPAITIKDHKLSKETKDLIAEFNTHNPKWYLLGRTMAEHQQFIKQEETQDDEKRS